MTYLVKIFKPLRYTKYIHRYDVSNVVKKDNVREETKIWVNGKLKKKIYFRNLPPVNGGNQKHR